MRIRLLAATLVAVSAVAAGSARASTLTPCQPRTGTAVDQVVTSACRTAAPVVHVVCSLKVSLCSIEARAPRSRVSVAASAPAFDCEIEAMCRVLGILCPRCTSVDRTDASASTIPTPCPPRAIIERSGGRDYLVVRDPTKPCAYVVVPVPISPAATRGR